MAVVEHIGEAEVYVFCNLIAIAKVYSSPSIAIEEGGGVQLMAY